MFRLSFLCPFSLFLVGCSIIPPADEGIVSSIVDSNIKAHVNWYQGCPLDDNIQELIQNRLKSELNVNDAIQIALWNSPQVQALFENLGIGRAALIEAGLFSNPRFDLEVRYPNRSGFSTNIEYLITTSILDLILIPLRTKLAETEYNQIKLRVANEILQLAFEVRQVFYELMINNESFFLATSLVKLTQISVTLAERQIKVGNICHEELFESRIKCLEAQTKSRQIQIDNIRLNEKLRVLMGFNQEICFTISRKFPESNNYQCFNIKDLEAIAFKERLDLKIAYLELERLGRMLGLKEWWNYTNLQGGIAGERDTDRLNTIGPGLSLELPIFNYGQAERLRLCSQFKQAQNKLAMLQIQILADLREAHRVLLEYGLIIERYEAKFFPLHREILTTSEGLYNVGGLGINKLLQKKEEEFVAKQNYLESYKNYLISQVNLDRVLGGYLSCLFANLEKE